MQPISRTRITIVLIVTVLSLLLTFGTARYYLFLLGEAPTPTAPAPDYKTPPPPQSETVAYANWAKESPENAAYAQWASQKQNQEYLAYEQKADALRDGAIPLGLDLIGGADVTLVVDREKAIQNEVGNVADSLANTLDSEKIGATVEAKGETISLKLANKADAQRAAKIVNDHLASRITQAPSADTLGEGKPVQIALRQDELTRTIETDIQGAKRGITERVDALGVTQPRISLQGKDRIRIQVPGVKDPAKLVRTVIQPAELEFRLVHKENERLINPETGKPMSGSGIPAGYEVRPAKRGEVDKATGKMTYTDYFILVESKPRLTGKDLRSASVQTIPDDFKNPIQVSLTFKEEGAAEFANITGANVGRQLAILLDGVVRSHPSLDERIPGGRATIRGGFSQEEAQDLSQILKAGSLPAPLKIESKRTVGATMGADSIRSGVKALILGSLIIIAVMIAYYGTAGLIAVAGLILNALLVLAMMNLSNATLTLSGIGGILLTVGMAVDANILIYERMREEVRAGKPMKQAIALGFNRAFSAILDSNLTTLLSALVLLQFTEGSVFGFALTMTFGLIANLFTGLTLTYTLCGLWYQKFGHLSLGRFAILQNPRIDFIKMRFISWGTSSAIGLVAMLAVFVTGGINYGVDFSGGYRAEIEFKDTVDTAKLRSALLDSGIKDPYIQRVTDASSKNFYIIDMKYAEAKTTETTKTAEAPTTATAKSAGAALKPGEGGTSSSPVELTQAQFETALKKLHPSADAYKIVASSGFGPQASQEFRSLAIWVTLLSALAILLYLWFRFELVFGVAAVISLLHDLLIVFFVALLLGVQVNLEVIAAMMVLMGLSVNDTIVIFDRIRENTRTMAGKNFRDICNAAMNQTMGRTVMTSGGVIVAALCLLFVGGEGLRSFAMIYLLGVICGTYSSDFIAAPILYQWNKYKGDRVRQMLAAPKKKKEIAKPIRQGA